MMNNHTRTAVFTLTVIGMLLVLRALPPLRIGEWTARRVDVLSDILPRDTAGKANEEVLLPIVSTEPADSTVLAAERDTTAPETEPEVEEIPCEIQEATERIADYSADRGMERFYRKMTSGERVRIAYYGDSFVEGDILTGPLRQMLQEAYGGSGVGYVDMATGMEAFRQTVTHKQEGFEIHAVTDRHFDREIEGPNQRYFVPTMQGAKMSLECINRTRANESTIYFMAPGGVRLTATMRGDSVPRAFDCEASQELQHATVRGDFRGVEWRIETDSTAETPIFYGVTIDGDGGVQLDNFSLRSSGGQQLAYLPTELTQAFTAHRHYDLVVLHFGLNVANADGIENHYAGYRQQMKGVIAHVRQLFPGAAVLIVSCSDRATRDEYGQLETQPGLRTLVTMQHQMALDNRTAFWNLFEAMGGAGAMERMNGGDTNDVNRDYTHLTHGGGRKIARIFFAAIQASIAQDNEQDEQEP